MDIFKQLEQLRVDTLKGLASMAPEEKQKMRAWLLHILKKPYLWNRIAYITVLRIIENEDIIREQGFHAVQHIWEIKPYGYKEDPHN